MLLEDFDPLNEYGLVIPGVNTTVDVKPGEIKRQAAKFGFKTDANGVPPLVSKDSVIKEELPEIEEDRTDGSASPLTYAGWQKMSKAAPGTDEWFKAWFSLPFLTNGTKS